MATLEYGWKRLRMNKLQLGFIIAWCIVLILSLGVCFDRVGDEAYTLSVDERNYIYTPNHQGWFVEEGHIGYEIIIAPLIFNISFMAGIYILLEEKNGYFHRYVRLNGN